MKAGEKKMKMWCVSPLLSLFVLHLEANSGLKVRITQRGLNYGKEVGMKILQQEIKEKGFPDRNGTQTFLFGTVDYRVSRIQITSISIHNTSVVLVPENRIVVAVRDASARVSTHWTLNNWLLDYHGKAEISILGISVTATINMSQNNRGYLLMLVPDCRMSIGGIKVQLSGRGSWYYDMFFQYLEKTIQRKLQNRVCLSIKFRIQKMAAALKKLQATSQIDSFAQIDYSLTKPPEVFRSYIELDFKASVYPIRNHTELLFMTVPFSLPDNNDNMMYFGISEYFLKSLSLSYYTVGASKIHFSEEHSSSFNLTTEALSRIIPEIAQHYTESHLVRTSVVVTAAPTVWLQNNSLTVKIPCFVEVSALLLNQTMQPIFALNISAITNATVAITEQRLIGSLQLKRLQLSLTYSNIGSFQVSFLKNLLACFLHNTVILPINDVLKRGFHLPNMARIAFLGPAIKLNQGYILITTDVSYKY
ncbi:BPI fold-containing family C protein-like isoform X2 [Sceloporus undulatus]|uniref:BPI fold-containing family C protein-like isoform X2 n=1 Tax=Sceloporus undulatus TaxID=8520 RepID=UPI001C4C5865|nr:BPI fold-containing family C protein-like isoform X2 [Sceloporus undulatus]